MSTLITRTKLTSLLTLFTIFLFVTLIIPTTAEEKEDDKSTDKTDSSKVTTGWEDFFQLEEPLWKPQRPENETALVDFSEFITDQMDLYYYPDIPRLMQILNPRSYEVGGIKDAENRAIKARLALKSAEANRSDAERAVQDKLSKAQLTHSKLESTRQDKKRLQYDLSDKKLYLSDLKRNAENLSNQNSTCENNLSTLRTNKSRLESEQSQLNALKAGTTNQADIDKLDEQIRKKQDEIESTDDQIEGTEDQIKELEKQIKDNQAEQPEVEEEIKDIDETKIPNAEKDIESAQGDMDKAYAELEAARKDENKAREEALIWTEIENMAYKFSREHQSFWVSPANMTKIDGNFRIKIENLTTEIGTLGEKIKQYNDKDIPGITGEITKLEEDLKKPEEELKPKTVEKAEFERNLNRQKSKLSDYEAQTPRTEALLQEIQKIKDSIFEIEGKLIKIQNEIDPLNSQISKINGDITEKKTRRENLKKSLKEAEELKKKNEEEKKLLEEEKVWIGNEDPVQNVFIFAFPDRASLILRGKIDDISIAKDVIRNYDIPAPQARVTLWSLEMNSDASLKGYKNTNEAMTILDSEFSKTREMISATLTILQDEITNEVYKYVTEGNATASFLRDIEPRLEVYSFYSDDVLKAFGFEIKQKLNGDYYSPTLEELIEIFRSDREMQTISNYLKTDKTDTKSGAMGKKGKSLEDELQTYYFLLMKHIIPDPTHISTFGEASLVLCLANKKSRGKIINRFEEKLELILKQSNRNFNIPDGFRFNRLRLAYGIDTICNDGINGRQAIIIEAVKRHKLRTIMGAAGSLAINDDKLKIEAREMSIELFKRYSEDNPSEIIAKKKDFNKLKYKMKEKPTFLRFLSLAGFDFERSNEVLKILGVNEDEIYVNKIANTNIEDKYSNLSPEALTEKIKSKLRSREQNVKTYLPIAVWCSDHLGVDAGFLRDNLELSFQAEKESRLDENIKYYGTAQQFKDDQTIITQILNNVYSQYCGNNPYRLVAKGDQLLKEINIAMEDELDEKFIQPMLKNIRTRISNSGVGLGVVQRTSMLTTNRKLSRIEPLASAQLRLGEDINVIEDIKALIDIYEVAEMGNFPNLIKELDKLFDPDEDTSEVYGIHSGNKFEITPLFDATGQAHRFQLDHVYSTQIFDPDGSVSHGDLNIPRIEKTTLNTEVQLSNFEIREVSRFENNVKLGLPEKRSGGIPIIKDIPGISEIPLLGWFKVRCGKAAEVQYNVIFAQTTMYPTISEIVPLLTDSMFVISDREY
jgi:predicted  nucleic acid-binding Zn-ribbon protein